MYAVHYLATNLIYMSVYNHVYCFNLPYLADIQPCCVSCCLVADVVVDRPLRTARVTCSACRVRSVPSPLISWQRFTVFSTLMLFTAKSQDTAVGMTKSYKLQVYQIVRMLKLHFEPNRAFCDTSMTFGTHLV